MAKTWVLKENSIRNKDSQFCETQINWKNVRIFVWEPFRTNSANHLRYIEDDGIGITSPMLLWWALWGKRRALKGSDNASKTRNSADYYWMGASETIRRADPFSDIDVTVGQTLFADDYNDVNIPTNEEQNSLLLSKFLSVPLLKT